MARSGFPGAPALLITIDTEGDDLWSGPAEVTTRNARHLPRFQALCERHALPPTYLTDHEMARDPAFQELARDALARGRAEIGMHLHAWNTPPLAPLAGSVSPSGAYLIEYPEPVLREKVKAMTGLLEQTFATPVRSHRAGRWALDARYARALLDHGYRVDSSVTPHVSWQGSPGATRGGADYRGFPERPYLLDPERIHRAGDSRLLEVPMTIRPHGPAAVRRALDSIGPPPLWKRALRRFVRPVRWLRPNGRNLRDLLALADECADAGEPCAVFMLHSSELMPGGSPTFRSAASIERLYAHLEALFAHVSGRFAGRTLSAFHDEHVPRLRAERARGPAPDAPSRRPRRTDGTAAPRA